MKNHLGQTKYQSVNDESPRAGRAQQGPPRRACLP